LKVTVPVGAGSPAGGVSVAVSVNVWPSVIDAGATCVAIGNGAFATTDASPASLHAVVDAL